MRQATRRRPADDDGDPGADGVAVGAAALQAEGERPAAFGPVVEVGQGLVVRQDQHVLTAVVVEVAHGQAATHARHLPRARRRRSETSVRRPSEPPSEKLRGHQVRVVGPEVVDVAVGRGQVEPAVVVGVEEGDAEAQQATAGDGQAARCGRVDEDAAAQVAVERRRLAVEVGDGQVDEPVAVEVPRGDPHAGLVDPRGIAGHAGGVADLLEPHPAEVAEQEIGRGVVGDEQVDPAVVVEVGGDHPEAAAVAVDDPGLGGDIHEPPPVIAEEAVGQGLGQRAGCS